MNRQRNVTLAVIGVLVVAAFLIGQLTSGGGAGDRLLASGPTTTGRAPVSRGGTTTTVGGAAASEGTGSTTGSTSAAESGPTTTSSATPTTPTTAAAAPSPGPTSGVGARTSGVGGGGITGGIVEGGSNDSVPSGRGGGSSTDTSTTVTTAPGPTPDPGLQTHTLSQDDDGKTIAAKVSDLIVLRLEPAAGGYWSDPVSDAIAVTRDSSSTSDGVVLAYFAAVSAGTANLTATSGLTCTTATPPCIGAPLKTIKVTITVTA